MKKNTFLLLSILSGVLLALPWYPSFSGILSTVAFVPLLIIEDQFNGKNDKSDSFILYRYSFITFLIWNIIATYWIKNSDFFAAFAVIFTNTFVMSLTFSLFHITKKRFGSKIGNISLIVYWISFEYIFLHAHLTWPWLNLGNAFACDIKLIQWYEYTGTLGGTLWILILNLIFYRALKSYFTNKIKLVSIINISIFIMLIIIPIIISKNIFKTYSESGESIKIALLQPNFDPYQEKYQISQDHQLSTIINLADSIIDKNTNYVIAPETAISNPIQEHKLNSDSSVLRIKKFINHNPNLSFIIGASTLKKIPQNQGIPVTARLNPQNNCFYNAHNTALQIDTTNQIPTYYKSKLVSGVETMPFLGIFSFLEKFILDFGGVTGSLGIQKEREIFTQSHLSVSIAPVICYESAFGEHVSDFIKKGANLIFIITNDGWWGNTPGHKQHLRLSQLRAIETRRSIARSANTGISAFINQRGEIIEKTEWWTQDAIKNNLKTNKKYTFYVKYGDYIGRISLFIGILLTINVLVSLLIKKDIRF